MNGIWGTWQGFGPCSKTCGGGLRSRRRQCNNPPPVNDGDYCTGLNEDFEDCDAKLICPGLKFSPEI